MRQASGGLSVHRVGKYLGGPQVPLYDPDDELHLSS
jgi:hypothetical protein